MDNIICLRNHPNGERKFLLKKKPFDFPSFWPMVAVVSTCALYRQCKAFIKAKQ